jgi:hypothetical protein
MSDDIRTFEIKLKNFGDKTVPRAVLDARNMIALQALKGVVYTTPVIEGRARGNWQVTMGTPAEGYDPELKDKQGLATEERGKAVMFSSKNPFDITWLHNGVPYVPYLERGTVKTKAVGMVANTMARIRRHFGK